MKISPGWLMTIRKAAAAEAAVGEGRLKALPYATKCMGSAVASPDRQNYRMST
ncbi:MAG: hypothetical protein ACJARI_002458 [Bacteroidia bacterium]|jgi:hypothetical protein